jgi:hypothetical protein
VSQPDDRYFSDAEGPPGEDRVKPAHGPWPFFKAPALPQVPDVRLPRWRHPLSQPDPPPMTGRERRQAVFFVLALAAGALPFLAGPAGGLQSLLLGYFAFLVLVRVDQALGE